MTAPAWTGLHRDFVGDEMTTTWQIAREHLVGRLLIDEEWILDGDGELVWWPWFLPQRITSAVHHEQHGGGPVDSWLHLRATTQVLRVADAEQGHAITEWANSAHPAGAFVWRDGIVELTSTAGIRSRDSGLLNHFHHACLIQTSLAHEIAQELADEEGVSIPRHDHPRSGARQTPDELLSIYGDHAPLPLAPALTTALAVARPLYRQRLLDLGFAEGWSNDEVDYVDAPEGMDVAVGRLEGSEAERRWGTGLVVLARWMPPGWLPDPGVVNMLNDVLTSDPRATGLGWVAGGERAEQYGMHTRTYLGQALLAEHAARPEVLATAVVNAALHAFDAACLLRPPSPEQ